MMFDSLKIGVAASALGGDFRAAAQRARLMGFAGLQFDAYATSLSFPDLSMSGRREFLRLLSTQDRQFIGLRFDLGAKGFGPGADVDQALDRLSRAMESAASMGSPLVCVDVGPLPSPPRVNKPRPKISPDELGILILPQSAKKEEAMEQAAPPSFDAGVYAPYDAAMAELGSRADRYSAIVAFRSDLASLSAIERVLKSVNCPWFGVDLDPQAVLRDEWTMDELFSRLGPLIRHVRGRDGVAGTDQRTKPTALGAGSTDWGALLASLDESDYRGWITIDTNDLTDRTAAAEVGLKRLLAIAAK